MLAGVPIGGAPTTPHAPRIPSESTAERSEPLERNGGAHLDGVALVRERIRRPRRLREEVAADRLAVPRQRLRAVEPRAAEVGGEEVVTVGRQAPPARRAGAAGEERQ